MAGTARDPGYARRLLSCARPGQPAAARPGPAICLQRRWRRRFSRWAGIPAAAPGTTRWRTTFGFDLSRAPKGSRGVSSLGAGTVTAAEPLDASALRQSFFMAGPIGTWPAGPARAGFFGAWQGRPAFDAGALLAWTGALHGHYRQMFGQIRPAPYGVFLRYNPINAGGGWASTMLL
jgi:hypothetical protein